MAAMELRAPPPTVQPIPADPGERIALAWQAWLELEKAGTDLDHVENILRLGEFAAKRHNLSRSDQFRAFTRKTDARNLLIACLEFGQ